MHPSLKMPSLDPAVFDNFINLTFLDIVVVGKGSGSITLQSPTGIQFSGSLPIMEWKKHWSFWLMSFTGT